MAIGRRRLPCSASRLHGIGESIWRMRPESRNRFSGCSDVQSMRWSVRALARTYGSPGLAIRHAHRPKGAMNVNRLDRSLIAGLPVFEGLDADCLDNILQSARSLRMAKETTIFEQ